MTIKGRYIDEYSSYTIYCWKTDFFLVILLKTAANKYIVKWLDEKLDHL